MPKITLTGSYQTRDGRKARVLAVDVKHRNYSVVAIVAASDGMENIHSFGPDGKFDVSIPELSDLDLIPIPKPFSFERWVNVYPDTGSASAELCDHKTKEAADACSLKSRIACVRVTISGVEGEGL
jgi:hypothetical protein